MHEKNSVLRVSALPKTWILDLDGTIVKHNGYLTEQRDTLLEGAKEFLSGIKQEDMVIFITSRTEQEKLLTEQFLRDSKIRFDAILYNAPFGERILINDQKPSGLKTAIALCPIRDRFFHTQFIEDKNL